MKLSLVDYIFLNEDNSPWSKTVFSGKNGWEHRGSYSYAKTLLGWLLNKEGVDRPQGLYLGRDNSKEKRIVSFDDLKFSDSEKKQLEEMYNNISKYKYSDLDKILKRFGFKWGNINKKQFSGVGGGDGNVGNQFELDFMNDFDEKWESKIKEITGCKEIKNKTLDGGKNQKRPYNFNSDGSITAGKEGSYNIGSTVTDITLETDKGPIYLSLKSGKLLSFANIGCIGKGADQIIPRSWYNSDNEELPEKGKNLLNILGIDSQRFKQVFNHRENNSNSNKVKKATYEKVDVTKELQSNKNFLKLVRSCIGCGYIMVHQNQGDDVDFMDLRDESKLQQLTSKVISADVNYPKDAKRVEVHVDMPGIWISFDARPADGGPIPNRIHVRYKFK
jgi:hypothetical protein